MAIRTTRNRRLGTVIPGTAVPMNTSGEDYTITPYGAFPRAAGAGLQYQGPTPTRASMSFPQMSTTSQTSAEPSFDIDVSDLDLGIDFGITGGGTGTTAANILASRKFEAEQKAARDALTRQQTGAAAQLEFLRSQLGATVPTTISGEIAEQERLGREAITTQAQALANLISGRRTQGLEELGRAYGGLATYLEQNVPQAFAQAQRAQPQTVQSALAQYMAGQGVSPAVAQEAANIANVQAAGGAANFNQLLDVLAAREAAAQQSRLAEAEMSRAAGVRGLETLYGTVTSQLEQQRLAALADLNARISQARLAAQEQAASREQAVQNAISQLIGTGLIPGGTPLTPIEGGAVTTPPAKPTPIEQLAAKTANIKNQTLVNRVENFVASNPNATPAQIRKEFPSLGKGIKR